MRDAVIVMLALLGAWLTFFPMVDATKQGRSAWPWIIGGLVAGPLSGIAYLSSRRGVRAVEQREAQGSA